MEKLKTALSGLGKYLSDWKNLLSHALVGVGFLLIAIYTPVNIYIKLVVIALIIAFNITRMRRKAKKKAGQV